MKMSSTCEMAVIGAGPYGLAATSYLRAAGVETIVFGRAMEFWKHNMPQGMFLRSSWPGSHIGDPAGKLTLDQFSATGELPRCERIPLDYFVRYGEWFQRQAIPDLDERTVVRVERAPKGFRLTVRGGETIQTLRVAIATGLVGHGFKPPQFDGLPASLASHASERRDLSPFKGMRVAVIGAGQSALECAVLLLENGAEVDVIARTAALNWIGPKPDVKNSVAKQLLWRTVDFLTPDSAVGPFPLNWVVDKPRLLRLLSPPLRRAISTRALRPAVASWLIPRSAGLNLRTGRVVLQATRNSGRLSLQLDDGSNLEVDHVLLATGYRIDINNYPFLAPELVSGIASANRSPVLSRALESSVPGLHFLGASAVSSGGPLMRFVCGSGFAARNLTDYVVGRGRRPALLSELREMEAGVEPAVSKNGHGTAERRVVSR